LGHSKVASPEWPEAYQESRHMLAYTVRPSDDGSVVVESGLRLERGRFALPQMLPTDDLLATHGENALVPRTTPYRRLDPDTPTVDLGPETLPDVRALVLLDGRGATNGAFFAFVHHSDGEAGVRHLIRWNAREGQNARAQMVELVVMLPGSGVPVLLGPEEATAVVMYDGRQLTVNPARRGLNRAARPMDVLLPV